MARLVGHLTLDVRVINSSPALTTSLEGKEGILVCGPLHNSALKQISHKWQGMAPRMERQAQECSAEAGDRPRGRPADVCSHWPADGGGGGKILEKRKQM